MAEFTPEELEWLKSLKAKAALKKAEPVSKAESAARGLVQGATLGFGEEIGGLAKAAGRKLGDAFFGLENQKDFGDRYRQERDAIRADDKAAQEANPGSYLAGNITGGVTAGLLIPGGASATLGRAALTGAAFGAGSGVGMSEADLTKGEVLDAATDAAKGAVIGGVTGAGGYGAAKAIGAGIRKLQGKPVRTGAAGKIASEIAEGQDELSAHGYKSTQREVYKRSQDLEKSIAKTPGNEGFQFSPAEATGSPQAALAESAAAQFPKTMNRAQAARAQRVQAVTRHLDSLTNHIAADPQRLGRTDLAKGMADTVELGMNEIFEARSAAADPVYEAAKKSGATIPYDDILGAIQKQMDDYKFSASSLSPDLKTIADKIKGAAVNGELEIKDIQNLRVLLNKTLAGKGTLIDKIDDGLQEKIAGEIKAAVDGALEKAAAGNSEGAQLIRKGNAIWAEYSKQLDELPLQALNKVLKTGQGEAPGSLIDKIVGKVADNGLSGEQITGLMTVLEKNNPAMARQLRAETFYTILTRSGAPDRMAPISSELGVSQLNTKSALESFRKIEPKLQAMFKGDARALMAFRESMEILQRMSAGPGLRGAQTAPLGMQALEDAGARAADAIVPGSSQALKAAKSLFTNKKAMAEATSTNQGLRIIRDYLDINWKLASKSKVPAKVLNAFVAAATRFGLLASKAEEAPMFTVSPANLQTARFEQP